MAQSRRAPFTAGRLLFLQPLAGSRIPQAIDEALEAQEVQFAFIQGIGGLRWARIAVFSPEENRYYPVDVEAEPGRVLELASLQGNSVKGPDGSYYTHLHVVIARKTGEVYAGHLIEAEVDPFAEILVLEAVGGFEEARRMLAHRWGGKRSEA